MKKRLADELIGALNRLREVVAKRQKIKTTVWVACERCGIPLPAKETRGGWCPKCNAEPPS